MLAPRHPCWYVTLSVAFATPDPKDDSNDDTTTRRWPKSCGCGETWSREHWGELTPVGRYHADEWIELRTCVCGKTLAVPMSDLGDVS